MPVSNVGKLHFGQRGGSVQGGSLTENWGSNYIWDWGMMPPSNGVQPYFAFQGSLTRSGGINRSLVLGWF
jgi:hypothetical protein